LKIRLNRFITMIEANTYDSNHTNIAWLALCKLALLCLMTCGMMVYFVHTYSLPISNFYVIGITVFFTSLFYIIMSVLRTREKVILIGSFYFIFFVIFIHFTNYKLILSYTNNFFLKALHSRLLYTRYYMTIPESYLVESNPEFMGAMLLFLGFTAALVSLICVFFFRVNVVTIGFLSMMITLYSPAFLAELCGNHPSFFVSIGAYFALLSSFRPRDVLWRFLTGDQRSGILLRQESEFKSYFAKEPLFERAKMAFRRYNRYAANGVAILLVSGISLLIATTMIPQGSYIDYKALWGEVVSVVDSITDSSSGSSNLFDGFFQMNDASGFQDNGYFSDFSSLINYNSHISIQAPPSNDREVLKVTIYNKGYPVYLRGDIGINYTGNSWTTWSNKKEHASANEIIRSLNTYDLDIDTKVSYKSFFNDFNPEGISAYFSLYGNDSLTEYSNVRLEYLRNSRIVYLPYNTSDFFYKSDKGYNWNGDTMVRSESNLTELFIPLAFNPLDGNRSKNEQYFINAESLEESVLYDSDFISNNVKIQQYLVYREFVGNFYTKVPEEEQETIRRMINQMRSEGAFDVSSLGIHNEQSGYDSGFEQFEFLSQDGIDRYNNLLVHIYTTRICDYFQNNYMYSLTADNDSGDKTKLETFLFETKEGHCALYASACTLMLRSLGIPARYVTGFIVTGYEQADQEGYTYIMKESNLHAWTEVYFQGIGWLPYDPTPGTSGESNTEGESTNSTVTTSSSTSATTKPTETTTTTPITTTTTVTNTTMQGTESSHTTTAGETQQSNHVPILLIAVLGVLLLLWLIVLAVLTVINVKRNERQFWEETKNAVPSVAVSRLYHKLLQLLSALDLQPKRGESPSDFFKRVDKQLKEDYEDISFTVLVEVFMRCEFGKGNVTESESETVYEMVSAFYQAILKKRKKFLRFFFRADIFGGKKEVIK
jgi:hypothetical protein